MVDSSPPISNHGTGPNQYNHLSGVIIILKVWLCHNVNITLGDSNHGDELINTVCKFIQHQNDVTACNRILRAKNVETLNRVHPIHISKMSCSAIQIHY